MRHGFARGDCATFGLVLGLWTQLLVVAVGLGAVIATSALAFAAVKLLNAVNPKGRAFMLAVVPQFLTPASRSSRNTSRSARRSPSPVW